jgi:hypothetical protein
MSYRKSVDGDVRDSVPPCILLATEHFFAPWKTLNSGISFGAARWGAQAVKSPRQGAIGSHTLGHGYVAQTGQEVVQCDLLQPIA